MMIREVRQASGGYEQVLRAEPEALRTVRDVVADALAGWHYADDEIKDAQLVAVELATNAVAYGECSSFTLHVTLAEGHAVIEVGDDSPAEPVRLDPEQPYDPVDLELIPESGRGLLLVSALSTAWGSRTPDHGTGKIVWATLPPPQATRTVGGAVRVAGSGGWE